MKILFISPTGTLDNGAELSGVQLMSYLTSCGHNVTNVFPTNHHETFQKYSHELSEIQVDPYPISSLSWWWPDAPNSKNYEQDILAADFQSQINDIRQLISSKEIELVISNTVNVFTGALAAASEEVRHFWLIHEFPFGEFEYYASKIPLIEQLSDAVFAVQGELYRELENHFSDTGKLHSFVPFTHLKKVDLQTGVATRLISIGKLSERKNQLELVKTFHQLESDDLELVFIGGWDEDYKKKIDNYIQENQLTNIEFKGYQNEPWKFASEKDICVFTSSLEAFPLVYVESILNAVPVIISDNPGHMSVKEVFDAGEVYPLGNIEQLELKVKNILSDYVFYKEKAKSAQECAQNEYTVEKCSQTILNSITEIPYSQKPLTSLSFLLGLDLEEFLKNNLFEKSIRVYFERETSGFSENDSITLKLNNKGSISFPITSDVKSIRLDFSEIRSILQLDLVDSDNYEIQTNAHRYKEMFVFDNIDPQLILIPKETINSISLSYIYYPFHSKGLQQVMESHYDIRKSRDNLRSELFELERQHQSVIQSKRWKIATKLINIFRRNS
ncbi:glycosyltransferase family 4 protein [Streptococcus merionis]|uniref:glycosyltransferase family 4 protein n=1 Tax=Streptococcus merionis TaxID=400065 RepID=UPI0035111661